MLLREATRTVPKRFALSIRTLATMPRTVSDEVFQDHNELKEYANAIFETNDQDDMTRFQNQFTWELTRHSIAEEIVTYPAFEKYLGQQGKQMADKDRNEHQSVKEKLFEFQKMKSSDPKFKPALKSIMDELTEHMKEEETDEFPALEKAVSGEESSKLATSFQRTKYFVPTHSHPSAPNKPPFETAAGLMSAPLDKLIDLFKKFPDPERT